MRVLHPERDEHLELALEDVFLVPDYYDGVSRLDVSLAPDDFEGGSHPLGSPLVPEVYRFRGRKPAASAAAASLKQTSGIVAAYED